MQNITHMGICMGKYILQLLYFFVNQIFGGVGVGIHCHVNGRVPQPGLDYIGIYAFIDYATRSERVSQLVKCVPLSELFHYVGKVHCENICVEHGAVRVRAEQSRCRVWRLLLRVCSGLLSQCFPI